MLLRIERRFGLPDTGGLGANAISTLVTLAADDFRLSPLLLLVALCRLLYVAAIVDESADEDDEHVELRSSGASRLCVWKNGFVRSHSTIYIYIH